MKTMWSVELEGNMWEDDSFNGTFEEYVDYCKENGYEVNGTECRLAEILIDDDCCCVAEVTDIVNSLEV